MTAEPTIKPVVKKGVMIKIFGVILLLLGAMDCMLMWRGGLPVSINFYAFIVIGLILIVIGSIRQRSAELTTKSTT